MDDSGQDAFPWRSMMAFGFGPLGLSSAAFWAMTPRELAAAVEGMLGVPGGPTDRTTLDGLMNRFPDRSEDNADTGR